jgi:hypothetical protein
VAVITVSLKDVVMGGVFGPVHVDFTRAQVHDILGDPEDWMVLSRRVSRRVKKSATPWIRSGIWMYGDIEFHFWSDDGWEDRLMLIYTDDFTIPTGGKAIDLDPWIIRRGLTQQEAERELRAARIEFRRIAHRFEKDVTGLAVGSRIRLWFEWTAPDASPFLYAFSCADSRVPSVEKIGPDPPDRTAVPIPRGDLSS